MITEFHLAFGGVVLSSLFAGVGLFLNYTAVRKSNRIAVSSKLAELSNLLSDETKALTDLTMVFREQQEKAEQAKNIVKIKSLKEQIDGFKKRQKEIGEQIEAIAQCFKNLNSVDPTEVDSMICKSYFQRGLHEHGIEYARRLLGQS